jgi:hypothetical protein
MQIKAKVWVLSSLVVLVAVLFVDRYTLMNLVFVGKAVVDSNGPDASFHSTAA